MMTWEVDDKDMRRTEHMRNIDKRMRRTNAQLATCQDPELKRILEDKQRRRRDALDRLCCCRSFVERSLQLA